MLRTAKIRNSPGVKASFVRRFLDMYQCATRKAPSLEPLSCGDSFETGMIQEWLSHCTALQGVIGISGEAQKVGLKSLQHHVGLCHDLQDLLIRAASLCFRGSQSASSKTSAAQPNPGFSYLTPT